MVGVVFLAGGQGRRFGSNVPKQFLYLNEKAIGLYSLEIFLKHAAVKEIAIVTHPNYASVFHPLLQKFSVSHCFALPGPRRQDSVENGFRALSLNNEWICIHDAARPFISHQMLERLFETRKVCKAATVAIPITSTIKTAQGDWVEKTLDREKLWEIQTPQLVHREILDAGFCIAKTKQIAVTDDVSLAELVNCPVKLVKGSPYNMKITRKEDLLTARVIASDAQI